MAKYFLNNDEITIRVVALMERLGMTKYKFAKKINVNRSTFTKIFSGKQNWTIDILYNISIECKTSLDYLVTGVSIDNEVTRLKSEIEQWKQTAKAFQETIKELIKIKENETARNNY